MKKRKFLLALFAWMLVLGSVNAAATIETIEAPNAPGYSWLKFDDGNWNVIMLLDRNVWATKSGTVCSATDTWACGYHYQRWNNYWFAHPGVNGIDSITTSAVNWQTDASSYWPNNPYSSGTFYKWYSDWSSVRNDNLRWWAEDSEHNNRWYDIANNVAYTVTGRQWPCPDWYHIPSQWERWTILTGHEQHQMK